MPRLWLTEVNHAQINQKSSLTVSGHTNYMCARFIALGIKCKCVQIKSLSLIRGKHWSNRLRHDVTNCGEQTRAACLSCRQNLIDQTPKAPDCNATGVILVERPDLFRSKYFTDDTGSDQSRSAPDAAKTCSTAQNCWDQSGQSVPAIRCDARKVRQLSQQQPCPHRSD